MALTLNSNDFTAPTWLTIDDFPKDSQGNTINELETEAVIGAVAAIGEVYNPTFNTSSNKVAIRFDVKTPSDDVKEYWVQFTASIHERSKLGKMIRRWAGNLTEEQIRSFTLDKLLNKQVRLEIIASHSKSGKTYLQLETMKRANEGQAVAPITEPFIYDIDDPKQANLDKLQKFVQEDIKARLSGVDPRQGETQQVPQTTEQPSANISDLPF